MSNPIRIRWKLAVGVALLTAAVFAPATGNAFLYYDDEAYVTANAMVRQGLTWRGLGWAWTHFHSANWHPLTWMSHMLDVELWGLSPAGHHLTSVGIHALGAALLFLALAELTGREGASLVVALLFALHPTRVQSVAWIAERKDVLSGCWFAATLWCHALWAHTRRRGFSLGALGCFVLGLLSKPMLVTVPFVLLLVDAWPLGRLASPSERRAALVEKLPYLPLILASCVVTILAQHAGHAIPPLSKISPISRVADALVGYTEYLQKTVWPVHLVIFYPLRALSVQHVATSLGVVIAISVACVLVRRRFPSLLVGWLWFIGMLVPVSGLLQVGSQRIADRYLYLPQVGLFLAAVFALPVLPRRAELALWGTVIGAAIWVTELNLPLYRDTSTLFDWALQVEGANNAVALQVSTRAARMQDDLDLAERLAWRGVQLYPKDGGTHVELGLALERRNRLPEALHAFEEAHRLDPGDPVAWHDLGVLQYRLGHLPEAIATLRAVRAGFPDEEGIDLQLGTALALHGELAAAREVFAHGLERNPSDPDLHFASGTTLARLGDYAGAIREFEATLALKPDDAGARQALDYARADQAGAASAPTPPPAPSHAP